MIWCVVRGRTKNMIKDAEYLLKKHVVIRVFLCMMGHMNTVVICLGNPGSKYEKTWHNAAWILADQIISSWEFNKYAQADMSVAGDVVWVKPQTFMNNSGEVLGHLKQQYGLGEDNLVVVYDDLDLPLGSIKIAHNRGDGGHNGIKSIVLHFGSQAFTRVRIGIAPEGGRQSIPGDFRDYVLRNMDPESFALLSGLSSRFEKMIQSIHTDGYDQAMNVWNESSV